MTTEPCQARDDAFGMQSVIYLSDFLVSRKTISKKRKGKKEDEEDEEPGM